MIENQAGRRPSWRRFDDARSMQEGGACNPSGIARSLVQAIDEARADNADARTDPAVQLILHQLAHVCGLPVRLDWRNADGSDAWDTAMAACLLKVNEATAKKEEA